MRRNYWRWLIPILVLAALAAWVVWPDNPGIRIGGFDRKIELVRGLDLQGGLQVLLEADLPPESEITAEQMQTARDIIENRVNALGLVEPLVQVAGSRRIVVELPGVADPEEAVATIQETGLLEFVDMSTISADLAFSLVGTVLQTDFGQTAPAAPSPTPAGEAHPATPTADAPLVFHTVMTGTGLKSAAATANQTTGEIEVAFALISATSLAGLQQNADQAQILYADATSDVAEEGITIGATRLLTALPNPFRASTQLGFTLAKDERVEIKLYDISGRIVRGLLAEALPAGEHYVSWDGFDDRGVPVAGGVYYARLVTNVTTQSRAILLLR